MRNLDNFEFVNRTEELEALRNRVFPHVVKGTFTFLRSPLGFGKSRLTDRLIDEIQIDGPTCIVVDPAIRSKSRSDRIYAWFFVQRAAEPTAKRTVVGRQEFRTFADFLRKTQWRKINWKQVYENSKGVTSFRDLIKVGIEFAENLFKFGRYNPDTLLQEDSRFAGEVAQKYVRELVNYRPTLLVVRESQNIDPESLKFFLSLGEASPTCSIIFEYTNLHNFFSAEHEKIIFETITEKTSLAVFDLLRLNLKEFHYLLKKYAPLDQKIESIAELQWDGNLRIIRELKYRVMVGGASMGIESYDLKAAIQKNISSLSARRKLILALVATNIEAIDREVLISALRQIDPTISTSVVLSELTELERGDGYIRIEGDIVALADEDLIDAVMVSPAMLPMLKLAATSLRDFYIEIINGNKFTTMRLQSALRQAIALCASTGDIFALRNLVRMLDLATRQAHNQTLYINIVADVVLTRGGLSELEKQELIGWASSAAYEAGDFATASKLIEALPELRSFDIALLACCYGEINRHEDALGLAAKLSGPTQERSINIEMTAKLIECLSLFAMRKTVEAIAVHTALRNNEAYAVSPLFGFVLRFTELASDFPDCTHDVLASVEVFHRAGLSKSAAYSQLAGAMHLAYMGQIKAARQLVAKAEHELQPHVHDQQIILNNSVVIDLLTRKPNFSQCLEKLSSALFTVGDDFSRLTLHNNRLICYALTGDSAHAIHTIEVIDQILAAPIFGNRDIFITVCFNIWRYYLDAKQPKKAVRYKEIALSVNLAASCYPSYWKFRFELEKTAEAKFNFLLRHKYHPNYLSHWLIDLEGLDVLKEEVLQ